VGCEVMVGGFRGVVCAGHWGLWPCACEFVAAEAQSQRQW